MPTKHPPYPKMVIIAIKSLKKCNENEIKKYISSNYKKLASGRKFDNAIQSAIKKGINSKYFEFDQKSSKYKLTTIGKIKSNQETKTRNKKNKIKKIPRKKKNYETATGRLTCCDKPKHRLSREVLYAAIKVMNTAIQARKDNMIDWEHGLRRSFDKYDFNHDGCLVKCQVIMLMVKYVGYPRETACEQVENIMKLCDTTGIGKITFEQFLITTPPMHRFVIYNVISTFLIQRHGCYWYGPGHQLPGLFRVKANIEFPNRH
eukprot:503693_1